MTVRVILEATAKPGTGNDLVAFFRSILPQTRAFEGCRSVETLQNSDDADNVVLVEVWDTREHFERYLAWRQEGSTGEQLGQAVAKPPSIRHFDVTDA